jgi:hypothetical protein
MPFSSYGDIYYTPHWESLQNSISFSPSGSTRTIQLKYYFYNDSRGTLGGSYYSYDGESINDMGVNAYEVNAYWAYFTSFVCNMPGATVDSAGKVNYLAIGE